MSSSSALTVVQSETREVFAGPEYERSGFHNLWWGKDYRDLWTTPVEVEVLDLSKEAGGLTPAFQVGGMQRGNFEVNSPYRLSRNGVPNYFGASGASKELFPFTLCSSRHDCGVRYWYCMRPTVGYTTKSGGIMGC
jgi:hypothetical protein